ncbi:FAD-dependent oxidoreductase, partial [Streptomyces tricolor]
MSRPRVVIVGAGFAGYRAARTLARLTRNRADITLLNPTDYFLYLPLLPQVAAGGRVGPPGPPVSVKKNPDPPKVM